MNTESNIWWIGPLVLTLLHLLYKEARLSHATKKGDQLVFRAGVGARVLLALGIVGFSLGTLASIGREEPWLLALGAALAISCCFGWPVTIVMDDHSITRHIWWKPGISIPWNEVSGVERNAGADIQVFGNHGQCITFTRYHIDPIRFQDEVRRRAGLSNIRNASDPPTIRI